MVSTRMYCLGCPFIMTKCRLFNEHRIITRFARLLLGDQSPPWEFNWPPYQTGVGRLVEGFAENTSGCNWAMARSPLLGHDLYTWPNKHTLITACIMAPKMDPSISANPVRGVLRGLWYGSKFNTHRDQISCSENTPSLWYNIYRERERENPAVIAAKVCADFPLLHRSCCGPGSWQQRCWEGRCCHSRGAAVLSKPFEGCAEIDGFISGAYLL